MDHSTIEDEVEGSGPRPSNPVGRSEEHTSELQSQVHLVCRLLLEKKNEQTARGSNDDRWLTPQIVDLRFDIRTANHENAVISFHVIQLAVVLLDLQSELARGSKHEYTNAFPLLIPQPPRSTLFPYTTLFR